MAHPVGKSPFVPGKKTKRARKKHNLVESVVVPVASSALVTTAAIHALTDHHDGDGARRRAGERRPARPPQQPSFLDKVAARIPFLKPVAAVQRRYGEGGNNQRAAAHALQAALSIFPHLLAALAELGFRPAHTHVAGHTDVAGRLVEHLGLKGESAKMLTDAVHTAEKSRKAASLVGFLGLLWSGLGLVGALQFAYNSVWQIHDRGLKDKAFGLLWLAGAGVLFVAGAVITTVLRWLPGFLAPVGIAVTFAVSFGLWLWTSRVLPNRTVEWRHLVPGAVLGAVGLEVLKAVGAYYVPRTVASSSQLYGSLGIVFAVLAWLLLFGGLVVCSAVLNVVRYEKHEGTVTSIVEAPPVAGAHAVADRSGRL